MTTFINTAISALDSQKSLLPFLIKDSIDNTGRTLMASSEGGKHEAREKFIEETGTSIFWMGGIPAVRWAINKVAKSKGLIDPDIHFKRINSDGIQNYFADKLEENGKKKFSKKDLQGIVLGGEKLGDVQKKIKDNGFIPNIAKGKYKSYHLGITAASILINLFMLTVALPKTNQLLSRIIISKEMKNNENNKAENANLSIDKTQNYTDTVSFSSNTSNKLQNEHKDKQPSFGALKDLFNFKSLTDITKMAENSQLNTVNSMLLLDYGISGSRVTFIPRDNNERIENAVKEGGIILFFYQAADWIKKGFETLANKGFKTPIDLDYKVITNKDFSDAMKKAVKNDEIFNFAEKTDELNIIKFIDKSLEKVSKNTDKDKVFDNFTLKMAQANGLIDVEYDEKLQRWTRHSKKYIETDKVADLNKNLKNFKEQALKHSKNNLSEVIQKTKAAKGISVLGNIAICSLSLSYLLPKLQYIIREHRTNSKEAPGIKLYKNLAENNQLKI